MCLEHAKPRDLICVQCRKRCCDTCALFGSHKGHDVWQQARTMEEIQMRTEVLMEMYQWLDKEANTLNEMEQLHKFYERKVNKEQEIKDSVTVQFKKWHQKLNEIENKIHNDIHLQFQKYD